MTIELRSGPEPSPAGLLEGWQGDRRIAVFVEEVTSAGARFLLLARASPIDRADTAALLDALTARTEHRGTWFELVTSDPLFRDLARDQGFTGSLRGPLAPALNGSRHRPDGPGDIREAIQQLLPGIEIRVGAESGPARSILRRAVSGVGKTFDLFAAPDPAANPTRFSIPDRDDLLVESIARCIDTTIAIRRHFGRVASSVRRVSFDHADFQLLHGHHAGSADRSSGLIHMNASFASVEGLTTMEGLRAQRSGGDQLASSGPFNQIDGIIAHEVWHQMEGALEARRSMDGIELRRRLGESLGVATLEQAVNGARRRSPDSWKVAHARLVDEVSAYGATAPLEATAEMFMLLWCANGESSPIVRAFGELIQPLLADFKD